MSGCSSGLSTLDARPKVGACGRSLYRAAERQWCSAHRAVRRECQTGSRSSASRQMTLRFRGPRLTLNSKTCGSGSCRMYICHPADCLTPIPRHSSSVAIPAGRNLTSCFGSCEGGGWRQSELSASRLRVGGRVRTPRLTRTCRYSYESSLYR